MWNHFINLLLRSWSSFTDSLGSTTLGFLSPYLVAIAVMLVSAIVILREEGKDAMKAHLLQTLKKAALVAIMAELLIYVPMFSWNIAKTIYEDHVDLATTSRRQSPYNLDLHILRFERGLFQAGKPIYINTYLRYDGIDMMRMRGYYKLFIVHLDDKDNNPDSLGSYEDSLWENFIAHLNIPDHGLIEKPKSNFWVTLSGPTLTESQVKNFSQNKSEILMFMGAFKWTDEKGDYEVDYCAFTKENPEVFIDCRNHNGPIRPTGRPTMRWNN